MFESFFEAVENLKKDSIKIDDSLYKAIDPTVARKIGSMAVKQKVKDALSKSDAKVKGTYKAILSQLPKTVSLPGKKSKLPLQAHISQPAALYLAKNGVKKPTELHKTTIAKAVNDYFYKSLIVPKNVSNDMEEVKRKINTEIKYGNDINNQQVKFVTLYRAAINKFLSAKTMEDALAVGLDISEIKSLDQEKVKKFYDLVKNSVKQYTNSDIIEKSKRYVKDLEGKSLDQIADLASEAIFSDAASMRDIAKSTESSTRKHTTSRKDLERKAKREAGENVPLLKKEEAAKAKRKKEIAKMISKIGEVRKLALDKLTHDRSSLTPNEFKDLLKQAGLKGTSASALMKKLEKNISKASGKQQEIPIKKADETLKKIKRKIELSPDGEETDVMSWFASMNESDESSFVDLGTEADENKDSVIDEYELRNYINRSRDIPSKIAFSAGLDAAKREMADKCFSLMLQRCKKELKPTDSKETRNGKILSIYYDCGAKVWGDSFSKVNNDYFSSSKYGVKKGNRFLSDNLDTAEDAKEFIRKTIEANRAKYPGLSISPDDFIIKKL